MLVSEDQLKKLLVTRGLLDQKRVEELIRLASSTNSSLNEILVERDVISDANLGLMIADFLNLPFVILAKTYVSGDIPHIVPEKMARKYKILPFARSREGVKVAMTDPFNTELQAVLAKKTGQKILPYLATEKDINNKLRIYRKDIQKMLTDLLQKEIGGKETAVLDDAPIIKIVDMLINYAYQDRASDIHIEIGESSCLVRFRIDGVLHDALNLPKHLHDRIMTRIKVLARLRTDEHLSAQDGKMRALLEEENLDIRVSIVPIVEGEKAVLRLLSSKSRKFSLLDLGMSETALQKVNAAINKSFGMILATGPTGSGKTSTIYALLKILNTREKNITTIEDPVEYRIRGVNQIQVNPKTNLTFVQGLRSILRQDPNIIFVGEIRDSETASIAVNAALTGHLVLSTLHTNNAATALPRLIDMDVEPFLVASTVNIIIAQRLVRRICEMCNTSFSVRQQDLVGVIPDRILKKIFMDRNEIRIYHGKGCRICHYTGYSGRVAIFEVLEITGPIRKLISERRDASVIEKEAIVEGMKTMLDDGLEKVTRGVSTLEEVLRVTKTETV